MRQWKLIPIVVGLAVAIVSTLAVQQAHASFVRVPEPGSFLLLGSGLAGLAGLAWRLGRRK